MTGFGRAEEVFSGGRIWCEIRSTNHKYLELQFKLSPELNLLEDELRATIKNKIYRGAVNINLTYENQKGVREDYYLNYQLLNKLSKFEQELKQVYNLKGDIDLKTIFSFPELIIKREETLLIKKEELKKIAQRVFQKALAALLRMKLEEGQALYKEFKGRVGNIRKALKIIKKSAEKVTRKTKTTSAVNNEKEASAQRPINEELSRLAIYTEAFLKTVAGPIKESVGRRLDFILTEMLRETDTILAKFRTPETALWGIRIKEEIDTLKEEVRNVE
jgi:uncharacterized protein (TIGR00255 family)